MRKKELQAQLQKMIEKTQHLEAVNRKLQKQLDENIIDAETRIFNEKLMKMSQTDLNTHRHGND